MDKKPTGGTLMRYIDFHCDTLLLNNFPENAETLYQNSKSVDFRRMKNADCTAQFFAIFLPTPNYFKRNLLDVPDDWDYVTMQINAFHRDILEHSDMIGISRCWEEYQCNHWNKKMSAFLTIEDGRLLNGSLENIKRIYHMGIRLLTLIWNNPNCLGFPHSADPLLMTRGLTSYGKEAVTMLNDIGILVDVSHLSDGGFWDVIELSRKPVIASHSNTRSVCRHSRNLTNAMIKAIADTGGCIGLNFSPDMVSVHSESTIQDLAAHLRHMISVGGIGCPAIGTDFDGLHGDLEIPDCSAMDSLWEYLTRHGFSQNEINHIAHKNAERVICEVIH